MHACPFALALSELHMRACPFVLASSELHMHACPFALAPSELHMDACPFALASSELHTRVCPYALASELHGNSLILLYCTSDWIHLILLLVATHRVVGLAGSAAAPLEVVFGRKEIFVEVSSSVVQNLEAYQAPSALPPHCFPDDHHHLSH
jgi:hypothetical protein